MARVKRSVNAAKKRREVLEQASGYRGQRSRLYRKAKEQVTHSLVYAYADRRSRKGDFRQLWITRINAAARQEGLQIGEIGAVGHLGVAGDAALGGQHLFQIEHRTIPVKLICVGRMICDSLTESEQRQKYKSPKI